MMVVQERGLRDLFEKLLSQAECRFGPRDSTWSLDRLWVEGDTFPETSPGSRPRTYSIRLTASTLKYPQQRVYQLAHESIHCLAPTLRRETLWFEEGLANHFALTLPDLPESYRAEAETLLPKLFEGPLAAIRALGASDEAIRLLRLKQPTFDALDTAIIRSHFGASHQLANALCQRLPSGRPYSM
jgi:hypothetical protein